MVFAPLGTTVTKPTLAPQLATPAPTSGAPARPTPATHGTAAGATGFVSESVNYLDVGLKLEVEPQVYLEDDVGIKIGLEVSNIANQIKTSSGTVAYQVGTRNTTTTLRLKDGET